MKKLGQEIQLSDELAADVALGGGMILPAELYDAQGITEQEESLYPTPAAMRKAPHVFVEKREKLLQAFYEYWKAPYAVPAAKSVED